MHTAAHCCTLLYCRYELRRDDPSPSPWSEEGKKRVEEEGYEMIYPEGYLEAQVNFLLRLLNSKMLRLMLFFASRRISRI